MFLKTNRPSTSQLDQSLIPVRRIVRLRILFINDPPGSQRINIKSTTIQRSDVDSLLIRCRFNIACSLEKINADRRKKN